MFTWLRNASPSSGQWHPNLYFQHSQFSSVRGVGAFVITGNTRRHSAMANTNYWRHSLRAVQSLAQCSSLLPLVPVHFVYLPRWLATAIDAWWVTLIIYNFVRRKTCTSRDIYFQSGLLNSRAGTWWMYIVQKYREKMAISLFENCAHCPRVYFFLSKIRV